MKKRRKNGTNWKYQFDGIPLDPFKSFNFDEGLGFSGMFICLAVFSSKIFNSESDIMQLIQKKWIKEQSCYIGWTKD